MLTRVHLFYEQQFTRTIYALYIERLFIERARVHIFINYIFCESTIRSYVYKFCVLRQMN